MNAFNNSRVMIERKTPKKIISWITILIIITVLFICISVFYKYRKYNTYSALILKDDYVYLKIYSQDLPNSEMYIYNKKVDYKVISNDFESTLVKCDLKGDYLITGNPIKIYFKGGYTTLFNEIKNKLRRE